MKSRYIAVLLGLLCVEMAEAQVDWARVERSSEAHLRQVMDGRTVLPNWVGNSSHFCYQTMDDQGDVVYYLQRAGGKGKGEPLLRSKELFVRQYQELTGKADLDPHKLYIHGIKFVGGDTNKFYFKRAGKEFSYDRGVGLLRIEPFPKELQIEGERSADRAHSADSAFTVLGQGYNLMLRENKTGRISPFSTEGTAELSFTYQPTETPTEGNARGQWWGDRYVVSLQDDSTVGEMTLVNWLAKPRPKPKTFRMPLPHDTGLRITRLWWGDASTAKGHFISIDKYEGQVVELNPQRSAGAIYFTVRDRWATKVSLSKLDVRTGKVSELITEECLPHMNMQLFGYRVIDSGRRIIWWSERTGRGNYYLYDGEGKLIRRLTQGGQMVAGNILRVDSLHQRMIFAGYGAEQGHNPYYRHYYTVGFGSGKQQLLTPEDAEHELELSPDGTSFVDRYSRMDLPPVWKAGQVDRPQRAHEFARIDPKILTEAGWHAPRLISLPAADDSTMLYGVLYLPAQMDSTKRYPLITNVYPGPQTDLVPRAFSLDDNGNQSLAEMGCIVLNIASRGSSPLRGRDFYCYGYGNLRDYPLLDDKHSIETLGKRYPFIDLGRVGIYGHSGGGFQTVAAMCTYPDLYKVGFAASGNHDNNIYISWWAEVFHGKGKIPTTIELAPKLKGKLMLAVGDMDNNVPPGSTIRLAQALIGASKDFQFFLFPGQRHDLDSPYYLNLIRYYFGRNLLGYDLRDTDIVNHR